MKEKTRLVKNRFNPTQKILIEYKWVPSVCSMHCHDFYELEIITEGSGTTMINGELHRIMPGLAVLLTPKDFHEYRAKDPIGLYNIQFSADSISEELIARLSAPTETICTTDTICQDRLGTLCRLLGNCDPYNKGDRACASKVLEAILVLLLDRFEGEPPQASVPQLQKAIMYIHSHFKENPSLSQVAEVLYLNERYFCSFFRKHTGKSYKQYLRQVKLDYAARLIVSTSLSITEIAAESGYASLSHFNREFKAFFECTPLSMRQKET